jgi:hypothetical protein
MELTEEGMLRLTSGQPAKALLPIEVSDEGRVMELREEQPEKALFPIVSTSSERVKGRS